MKKRTLGRSDLVVSEFCLGSMTWGSQNTMEEGHAQIDCALDHGMNFIDTAELYPTTPQSPGTVGQTELIIGEWFARTGRRSEVILASKIVGPGNSTVRPPKTGPISPETLRVALEASLRKLKTDYIDLYQLHWPNRGSYHFRQNWSFDPSGQPKDQRGEFREILETIAGFVAEGKIRHFGLSNESCWGAAVWLEVAEAHGLPRVVSIQNEYNLLCRHFDLDLAELSHQEDVGLLAYSPLAAGLLTGKYAGGAVPEGSRASINPTLHHRRTEQAEAATEAYAALARAHGLEPAHLALAFCASRPFMGSVILGATSVEQLATDIAAAEITLTDDVRSGIEEIRRTYPMPM
ncbi:aldo/keto reductase [Rhodobacteraceae bacterium DSL-40]|uniref:aldo/keto reductase n=1 Tax=Amaricoccus sp. B4 TaxID=3368557 RepID=UPI000DADB3BE